LSTGSLSASQFLLAPLPALLTAFLPRSWTSLHGNTPPNCLPYMRASSPLRGVFKPDTSLESQMGFIFLHPFIQSHKTKHCKWVVGSWTSQQCSQKTSRLALSSVSW